MHTVHACQAYMHVKHTVHACHNSLQPTTSYNLFPQEIHFFLKTMTIILLNQVYVLSQPYL